MHLDKEMSAAQVTKLTDTVCMNEKGYRMARASHGVREGVPSSCRCLWLAVDPECAADMIDCMLCGWYGVGEWYFEIIMDPPAHPENYEGHVRLGWATQHADCQVSLHTQHVFFLRNVELVLLWWCRVAHAVSLLWRGSGTGGI